MKPMDQILRKIEQVSHREKVQFTLEVVIGLDYQRINVYTSARLSMKGRYIIEKVLGMRTKPSKGEYQPAILGRRGTKTEKDGTVVSLTFYYVAECKMVGTKKEMKDVEKVVKPAETIIVREEVEVPVYECPKGVTM